MSVTENKLGKIIKSIREKKGIQAKFVAAQIGVDPSTISKYENGDRKISAEMLPSIAEALGVKIEDFFDQKVGVSPTNESTA